MRTFAQKAMGTKKVLLEPSVNAALWGKGIKNVPHRLRVRLHRKRNDNEDAPADEKLYTQVSVVPTTDFKVRPTCAPSPSPRARPVLTRFHLTGPFDYGCGRRGVICSSAVLRRAGPAPAFSRPRLQSRPDALVVANPPPPSRC